MERKMGGKERGLRGEGDVSLLFLSLRLVVTLATLLEFHKSLR